jgi:hypothetical protein
MRPDWSDRRIAGVVGISPKTVGALRKRPTEENSSVGCSTRPGRSGPSSPGTD